MKVIFGFANGLKVSAPVRFAGVDAGMVKDIGVFYDSTEQKTKVQVDIWLEAGTEVPADSTVWINQLGLLGEKYVEIIPGQNQNQLLEPGAMLIGEDPISFEQISTMIGKLAVKLDHTVDGINEVVLNPENQQSIVQIFDNLESFTEDIKANPWKLLYRQPRKEKKE